MKKVICLMLAITVLAALFVGCGCSRTKTSSELSSAVQSNTNSAVDGVQNGADDLMDGIENGADKVGDAVESVVDGVGDAVTDENKKPATESDIVAPSNDSALTTSQTAEQARNRA